MPKARAAAINAETVTTTVYGVDPWGQTMGAQLAALAQAPNAGRGTSAVTINPQGAFHGDAVVPVQRFMGEGQLLADLGGVRSTVNPVTTFHSSTSASITDPVMAALADQLSRGLS
jgi:hypothetical protein